MSDWAKSVNYTECRRWLCSQLSGITKSMILPISHNKNSHRESVQWGFIISSAASRSCFFTAALLREGKRRKRSLIGSKFDNCQLLETNPNIIAELPLSPQGKKAQSKTDYLGSPKGNLCTDDPLQPLHGYCAQILVAHHVHESWSPTSRRMRKPLTKASEFRKIWKKIRTQVWNRLCTLGRRLVAVLHAISLLHLARQLLSHLLVGKTWVQQTMLRKGAWALLAVQSFSLAVIVHILDKHTTSMIQVSDQPL